MKYGELKEVYRRHRDGCGLMYAIIMDVDDTYHAVVADEYYNEIGELLCGGGEKTYDAAETICKELEAATQM